MSIGYRPGTLDDSYAIFQVFLASVSDLGQRTGSQGITGGDDPAVRAQIWERRRSLFEHLARTAQHFWVAEDAGRVVGYARSTFRNGVLELTEFFVLPSYQSAGVGRELLARTLPRAGETNRVIIATVDTRALSRYQKAGLTVRFPICNLSRAPEAVTMPQTELSIMQVSHSPETLAILANIDNTVLGFQRDTDHAWLLGNRHCFVYSLGGRALGYGYVGYRSGPFALIDDTDYPAVLAHAESIAVMSGYDYFGVELPMTNRVAIQYLLARNFKLDTFFAFFLSDRPFGKFENYAFTSPPFFI